MTDDRPDGAVGTSTTSDPDTARTTETEGEMTEEEGTTGGTTTDETGKLTLSLYRRPDQEGGSRELELTFLACSPPCPRPPSSLPADTRRTLTRETLEVVAEEGTTTGVEEVATLEAVGTDGTGTRWAHPSVRAPSQREPSPCQSESDGQPTGTSTHQGLRRHPDSRQR